MNSWSKLVLAGIGLAVATPSYAANILTNGGFEDPVISTNPGYETYSAGSSAITGWLVEAGNVDIVNHYQGAVAAEGNQFLDLVGTVNGSISNTFATTLGQVYKLTFQYAHNIFSTSTASAVFDVNVTGLNGTVMHSGGASASDLGWQTYTGYFTAGSGSTSKLTLTNTVGANQGGLFADDFQVTAVPEPATWVSLILGFGLLGGALRRRKQTLRPRFA